MELMRKGRVCSPTRELTLSAGRRSASGASWGCTAWRSATGCSTSSLSSASRYSS